VLQGAQISSNALCGTPPAWAVFAVQDSIPDILAFAQPLPADITKNGKLSSLIKFQQSALG
jgi:hypothetical protein